MGLRTEAMPTRDILMARMPTVLALGTIEVRGSVASTLAHLQKHDVVSSRSTSVSVCLFFGFPPVQGKMTSLVAP